MAQRTYKLVTSTVASTFATTYVQFVERARIVCVDFSGSLIGAAAADSGMDYELTINSNQQIDTNDVTGVLGHFSMRSDFDSAVGRSFCVFNKSLPGISYTLAAGERVYLNTQLRGTAPSEARCFVVIHVV